MRVCVLHTGRRNERAAKIRVGGTRAIETAEDFGCTEWMEDQRRSLDVDGTHCSLSPLIREILREWMTSTMRDISEDHYAAGWMSGLEQKLWIAVQRLPEPTDYGLGRIDAKRLEKLKAVSELLGEWTDGENFIPLAEWMRKSC